MKNPSARMLELLSLLQSGREWNGPDLADRLGISPRTLRRDIGVLRELGYVVASSPGTGGSYRLAGGHGMPPLLLTDEEAVATAVGLRHAAAAYEDTDTATAGTAEPSGTATTALLKIHQVLPARLRPRIRALLAASETAGRPGESGPLAAIPLLASAVHTRAHVRFHYVAQDGRESDRHVEPYRLMLVRHRWHLLGWDLDRDDWRGFRTDRMRNITIPGTTFVPRPVPASEDEAAAGSVLFSASLAVVTPRLAAQAGMLEAVDDDHCRYTTPADDWDWLAGVLAAVAVPYVIEGPTELAHATRRLATRATEATRTSKPAPHHPA